MSRVLLITDDPAQASALSVILRSSRYGSFKVTWVRTLSSALQQADLAGIAVVVVNLILPDSNGIATYDRLTAIIPHTPIVTITASEDEDLALEAIRRGARATLTQNDFSRSMITQTLRNIIQRNVVELAYYKEKARAGIVLNSIGDGVISTDLEGRIDYLNIAAEELTGWPREEANGHLIDDVMRIINGKSRLPQPCPINLVLQGEEKVGMKPDSILVRRDMTEVPIEDSVSPVNDWSGLMTGAVMVFHDVGAAQAMNQKMTYLAQYDFLTDLPNRMLLNDRIAQSIKIAERHNSMIALLFLDLDGFKHINDSLGHESGDRFLQSVARRLTDAVRKSDTVSRRGGDEFLILLNDIKEPANAAAIADKVIASLKLPHSIRGVEAFVTVSVGISLCPTDGHDPEKLIKSADTAMYYAKANGGDNYQFFGKEMNTRAVERHFIEGHLRQALDAQEFVLHYQPLVNLQSGRITGAEALLRWNSADRGLVFPPDFITVAEDSGLIVPIGRWVLLEACTQGRRWLHAGLPPVSIAVNISAVEFRRRDFLEGVRSIIEGTGFDPGFLQLEITESALMQDAKAGAAILRELKKLGVQIALDDFGTGYSSLSYLKQFPIDILKIDKSFVQDIDGGNDDGIIVSAVIAMGNSLKKRVVAEGIENAAQLGFLHGLSCEEGQGYLFSRPVTSDALAHLLANGLPLRPADPAMPHSEMAMVDGGLA
ncbi:EAL domain-containing protein [Lichenicola cladoniae]|uniref:EAL domain-containing protein n=1 Tax=Lichenicola cladoniae TaxID=1484109 RepID=A0A6M8HMU4_9PROT|nr:EAL domain-containing protein [Lichenicola cladoniae]NPD67170.1 EAL domain-containing protein [Acetobacteraceae bacterium]QKE89694.1 EAL domain-containing protein [Lichenicola cladoniae]